MMSSYRKLDDWIDAHFVEETKFLQELVRVPTDTPPGDNAPHAQRTADLLAGFGRHHGRSQTPPPGQVLKPLPGNATLVATLQWHGEAVFGEQIPVMGSPLYTDVRLYGEAGIPAAIYGAGPRTVLESNAKRADEHVVLEDLRPATRVVARTLLDLLS